MPLLPPWRSVMMAFTNQEKNKTKRMRNEALTGKIPEVKINKSAGLEIE
jgi:hypothetical protein